MGPPSVRYHSKLVGNQPPSVSTSADFSAKHRRLGGYNRTQLACGVPHAPMGPAGSTHAPVAAGGAWHSAFLRVLKTAHFRASSFGQFPSEIAASAATTDPNWAFGAPHAPMGPVGSLHAQGGAWKSLELPFPFPSSSA